MSDTLLETTQPTDYSDKIFVADGEYILNATHRCDRCDAQAFVKATLSSGTLLFCSHHYNSVKAKLLPTNVFIRDETKRLTEKPKYEDED